MNKTTAILLVSGILLLQVGCQADTPTETTPPETVIETTQPLTSKETTSLVEASTTVQTSKNTPTPTQTTQTSAETTPEASTTATTVMPTPKPTQSPVATPVATTATATATAAPTNPPPPPTTAAPVYAENPEVIRELLVQYCKDNGIWAPDGEKCGDDSVQWYLGLYFSDADYANKYIYGKLSKTERWIKSVTVWIDGGYINIASEKAYPAETTATTGGTP